VLDRPKQVACIALKLNWTQLIHFQWMFAGFTRVGMCNSLRRVARDNFIMKLVVIRGGVDSDDFLVK